MSSCLTCGDFRSYANQSGIRVGCKCDVSNRPTIQPCATGDGQLECFRQKGYFNLIQNDSTINFCSDNDRTQTNDNMMLGCDLYFNYNNDIDVGADLASKIRFEGVSNSIAMGASGGYLKSDILGDHLAHISFNTRQGSDPIAKCGIMKTVMVDPKFQSNFTTPNALQVTFEVQTDDTSANHVALGQNAIRIKQQDPPMNLQIDVKGCSFGNFHIFDYDYASYDYHVYGLGPLTDPSREFSLDWLKRGGIRCNSAFGNQEAFGIKGSHHPVFYVLRFSKTSGETSCFGIFLDHYRKVEYDFTHLQSMGWINISTREPENRIYVMTGDNMMDIKQLFNYVTGPPAQPVRKFMGLDLAGFGYRSLYPTPEFPGIWSIQENVDSIRKMQVPMDCIVLDLYWYGMRFPIETQMGKTQYENNLCMLDVPYDPSDCTNKMTNYDNGQDQPFSWARADQLGIFEWDLDHFPATGMNALYDKFGYASVMIYEPYYNLNSDDMSTLYSKGLVARTSNKKFAQPNSVWLTWMKSAINMDLTAPESDYFYWSRVKSRLRNGACALFMDLSEPETYDQNALYNGLGPVINGEVYPLKVYSQHPSVHNMTPLLWMKAIHKGWTKDLGKRFGGVTRASVPGMCRYGPSAWQGDTYANPDNMASVIKNTGLGILGGQDFLMSDAGGFGSDNTYNNIVYTPWFANSCLIETAVKPHRTFDGTTVPTSSPTYWGNVSANISNIRWRYAMLPYYYSSMSSICKGGHRNGQNFAFPLFIKYNEPTLVNDTNAGLNYLVGDSLLAPVYILNSSGGYISRTINLPANTKWFDLTTNTWVQNSVPFNYTDGLVHPLILDNSIVPTADFSSVDWADVRAENLHTYPLIINIYTSSNSLNDVNTFVYYHDDGSSLSSAARYLINASSGGVTATYLDGSACSSPLAISKVMVNGMEAPNLSVQVSNPASGLMIVGLVVVVIVILALVYVYLIRKR